MISIHGASDPGKQRSDLTKYNSGQVPDTAKDAAGKNKTPPYDPGGMEAEISDCEQGTVRKIFCQPAVRL